MSSGNPFRASQSYKQAGFSPVPQSSSVNTDSSVPRAQSGNRDHEFEDPVSPPPQKTKKQVRIVSPTTSIPPHPEGDDVYGVFRQELPVERLYHEQDVGSPPPSVASVGFTDSYTVQGGVNTHPTSEGNTMAATSLQLTSLSLTERPQTTMMTTPSRGVPANPFSRTLATLEPQETASADDRSSAETSASGSSKAALDVESFKNLLLTGRPTPRLSAQTTYGTAATSTLGAPPFESGSSTDTSSLSHQSLLEPPHDKNQESSRTSDEMAGSDDKESMDVVPEVQKSKKKPPPAPKHRHGKPVTSRQPQVVSFDGFAATEPASAATTMPRDYSDVNKPLPSTPIASPQPQPGSHQDTKTATSQLLPAPPRLSDSPPAADNLVVQKRMPPPVPLARRQSQLRALTTSNRSRSNSSLTISSQHSVDNVSTSSVKSPPPPPRSRHGARITGTSTSVNSSTSELPHRIGSTRTSPPTTNTPSSRRSTLELNPDPPSPIISTVNRTASLSSTHHTPRTASGESTASLPPPPPPPPRRRHSNRSSLDQSHLPSYSSPTQSRRPSTELPRTSPDRSKRRTSVASESSLRREYAPVKDRAGDGRGGVANEEELLCSPREESEVLREAETETETETVSVSGAQQAESGSILDDMERFQREIDELRNRYQ